MATNPICINLYTCLGNGTTLEAPTCNSSPTDYVARAVAYRALQDYFRLEYSFLREAEKRMPNLTLSNALGAIVHDARTSPTNTDKKVLIVLAIDEIQNGLAVIPHAEHFANDDERDRSRRSFLRQLVGGLMALMAHSEPFFLVPMVAGLSYTNVTELISDHTAITITNLTPPLLTPQGMWEAIRTVYPSFAPTLTTYETLPRTLRTILAYIGGYPRGFQKWLVSVAPTLREASSSEWTQELGNKLAAALGTAIDKIPKPKLQVSPAMMVLKPLFQRVIMAAMRNLVVRMAEEIDSKALPGIMWNNVTDVSGFEATLRHDQRLEAPAMVIATWLHYAMYNTCASHDSSHMFEALRLLLRSYYQTGWDAFETQTANYVAFLLAIPEAGSSISLATLLFPFASPQPLKRSIFSTLKVTVPQYSAYRVTTTLSHKFPCQSVHNNPRSPQRTRTKAQLDEEVCICNTRQVVLNAEMAPFGDVFVVLQVSATSRTVETLGQLPFFDLHDRSLEHVVTQTQEEIDLVLCIQCKHSADGTTSLSASEIEEEWDKNLTAAKTSVHRFPRPFVLTMVVVSNRRGSSSRDTTKVDAITLHNKRMGVPTSSELKTEPTEVIAKAFQGLPRPYVVIAGTTPKLLAQGYDVLPVNEFFPNPLLPLINGMLPAEFNGHPEHRMVTHDRGCLVLTAAVAPQNRNKPPVASDSPSMAT